MKAPIAVRDEDNDLPMPDQNVLISLDKIYSTKEMALIRNGVASEVMEDKWDIYFENDRLYFHRNWTGYCQYVVRFVQEGKYWRMVDAVVNADPDEYQFIDDGVDAKRIPFLIDVLILRKESVFPDPSIPEDDRPLWLWGDIGRASVGQFPWDGSADD